MRRAWVAMIVAGGALLAVVGGLATRGPGQESGAAPAAPAFEPFEAVEIVEAREIAWQPTADLVGTVIAMRSIVIRNELSGVVREVGFQSGAVVEEGQVLLRLDEAIERADLETARAAVRVAEANITQVDSQIHLAEVELERLAGVQSRAIAEVELDRARARLESARADRGRWLAEVDHAAARVAQVEARLAKLTIRAPFRARVGLRTVHEGQYLGDGVDVATLQELTDEIYLDFAVPQEYAPRVTLGTTVMATGALLGPDPVPIKVAAVDSTVNTSTRNLRIRAVVDNRRATLVPGMSVLVSVPIDAEQPRIVVPTTAVRRAPHANSVFVIAPDEAGVTRARQRFVTVGSTIGEEVVVLDGLAPGERIAGAGAFKLMDGVKVISSAADAGPAAAQEPAN